MYRQHHILRKFFLATPLLPLLAGQATAQPAAPAPGPAPVVPTGAPIGNETFAPPAPPSATSAPNAAPVEPFAPPASEPITPPANVAPVTQAAAPAPTFTTSIEVKPRFEAMAPRDLTGGKLAYGILRSRVGINASLASGFSAMVQLQDTRFFGGSLPVAGFAPDPTIWGRTPEAFDLHQGFVNWQRGNYYARVGRQELTFGNERLLGTLDWANPGRTFDAIAGGYATPEYVATAFGALTLDAAPTVRGPDTLIAGVFAEQKRKGKLNLGAIALYDAAVHGARFNRLTVGARAAGPVGPIEIDVDGYLQLNAPDGKDNNYGAFMVGARAKYPLTKTLKVGVLADIVSGAQSSTWGAFHTLYGTNHKFYGFYDFFLNLPKDTNNQGLVDGALTADVVMGDYTANVFVHGFRAATNKSNGSAWYGIEPDFVVGRLLAKEVKAELGLSAFVPVGDALARGDKTGWFSYFQLTYKH